MIRLNNPGAQTQACFSEIESAIGEVLQSGWYILGEKTKQFESEFAAYVGSSHCIGVASGSDALEIALRAIGVGAGDEVITVANAGGYTTLACVQVGAVPVYADIDPVTLQMEFSALAPLLSKQTKAVVVTHLFGWMNDVAALRRMLDAAGYGQVKIIEDCAQVHGASLDGRKAGSLGDVAMFSFYPTKNLGALGDGGAIVTGSLELADRCRALRQYGWERKYRAVTPHGRNSRLDEMQAAILSVKLAYLDQWNALRREMALELQQAAAMIGAMVVAENGPRYVAHLCVLRYEGRDGLAEHLKAQGVETDIHYPLLDPDQPVMKNFTFRSADLTHSRKAVAQILSLPCHPGLTSENMAYIGDSLRQFKAAK